MTKLIDLQDQIRKLQKQAEDLRAKEFQATVAEILAKMEAFGITLKDLQPGKGRGTRQKKGAAATVTKTSRKAKSPRSGSTVAAKYRGPNGETWSGRGLMPKWLTTLVNDGQKKEDFAISPDNGSAS